LPDGLVLAAIPQREDPRDAIVGKRLAELAAGARIGTSSLRRSAQLRALRPDLVTESIRGNLDTRLRKLDEKQYDAIVLAAAGLKRLGWGGRITEVLEPDVMCSAVGQGALAIETRAGSEMARIAAALDHAATRAAVTAERAVLHALGGGCQAPIGAHALVRDGELKLRAIVAAPDGSALVRAESAGAASEAARLGSETAAELLERGARRIIDTVYQQ
jgi:hydroxymethylbilane synthase